VPEAAEALAISRSKLYELLASGAVESIRIDGSRRIPLTALEAYISRLRDGVMKRGQTWSYVIRVKDPETGISKPKWVGGFATEQAAKVPGTKPA